MAGYSVAKFVQEIKQASMKDEILADDLSMRDGIPTKDEIDQVAKRLKCKLPAPLVELMSTMEVSGSQLGHVVFGMGGFSFPQSLIEQNINVDDPDFIAGRGLLSIGLDVNLASPVCIPRNHPATEAGPPILVLDHERGKTIGPIYADFLTFLEGQAFLCSVWGQGAAIIRKGMQRILGPTLNGPAADYWREFFETV